MPEVPPTKTDTRGTVEAVSLALAALMSLMPTMVVMLGEDGDAGFPGQA
jgi:hypothetical protein